VGVIEPYTVREARIHVRHVRDLLKSVDNQDAYNGVDCNSLSFLNAITGGDILGEWGNVLASLGVIYLEVWGDVLGNLRVISLGVSG